MKILHLVMNLDEASGVVTFVRRLDQELRKINVVSEVLTETDVLPMTVDADVVHLHGIWRPHFHRMALKALTQEVPIVWSPHGMLAPWALRHKWLKKKLAWWLYQRADLKSASVFHVTSEQEERWVRMLGFKQDIAFVPLGAELTDVGAKGSVAQSEVKTLLFVGRVCPVKAIDRLVAAFSLVPEKLRNNWRLRIVGPEEDTVYAAKIRAEINGCGLSACVEMVGPKFGSDLLSEYATCTALALVSHSENFGATVIDAMGQGKVVVTGTMTPWREVAERKCGWWVDNDPTTLAGALSDLMKISDVELQQMGQRGRKLVEEKYTWQAVCKTMLSAYERVAR